MKQYLELLQTVKDKGAIKSDRTGTGTKSIFGYQMRFNLKDGFPIVTTKKTFLKAIISELLWFIEGSTDERRLAEIHFGDIAENITDKKTIWTANANAQGKELGYVNNDIVKELGPIYGAQWRSWKDADGSSIDQLAELIEQIKTNPNSRRLILSAWNVGELDKMALLPCHTLFQLYVSEYTKSEIMNNVVKIVRAKTNNLDKEVIDKFMYEYDNVEDRHNDIDWYDWADKLNVKTKALSCQLYQR